MPDQDEFDKLGPEWRSTYDSYLDGGEFYEVGDEVLRALPRILRSYGGCSVFPELASILRSFWNEKSTHQVSGTLWAEKPPAFPPREVNNLIDKLARETNDRRFDTVAVKSARLVACQLSSNAFTPTRPVELSNHLGACIIENFVCHRVLDIARAHAVGIRFLNFADSHDFHDQVVEYLRPHYRKFGQQLALDPTGQSIRRPPRLVEKQETSSILFDADHFRLDL